MRVTPDGVIEELAEEDCLILCREPASMTLKDVSNLKPVCIISLTTSYGHQVHCLCAKRAVGVDLARSMSIDGVPYRRFMRRFYVPVEGHSNYMRAILDLCAPLYDGLVTIDRNAAMTRRLCEIVRAASQTNAGSERERVMLDFGCGSGSAGVRCLHDGGLAGWKLVGFDVSPRMRAIALAQGLPQVDSLAPSAYDGAFAAYVFELDVPDVACAELSAALRPGAAFAANLHDLTESETRRICHAFCDGRLGTVTLSKVEVAGDIETILLFRANHA